MNVFVTVGSTRFDALVEAVLSADVLQSLYTKDYRVLIVQSGHSRTELSLQNEGKASIVREGIDCEVWKFKPSLKEYYEQADLVISHAGSGTILEVLRLNKPLIVVPNPTLLDNHQQELANALSAESYLFHSSVDNLSHTIRTLNVAELKKFPALDSSKFKRIVDEEMGFL